MNRIASGVIVICLLACDHASTPGQSPDTGEPDATTPPLATWAWTFGGEGVDSAESVLELADGYVVVGRTGNEDPVLSATFAALVLRLEHDGRVRWQKVYGSLTDQFAAERVFATTDGFFVAGSCSPINFRNCALGLDGEGRITWQRSYWGGWDDGALAFRCFFVDVKPMSNGGYVLVSLFDEAPGGLHVIRIDGTGSIVWQSSFAHGLYFAPAFVQETPTGGLLILGESSGLLTVSELDSAGTMQRSFGCRDALVDRNLNAVAARVTDDGGLAIFANGWVAEAGGFTYRALFMLRLDQNGEALWLKAYETDGFIFAHSVQPTSSGGFVVAGDLQATGETPTDGFILEVDLAGNTVWKRAYGGLGNDSLTFVVPTVDNGFIASGWTESFGAGDKDVWVMKLDGEGALDSACSADLTHEFLLNVVEATPACQPILPSAEEGMALETDPNCSIEATALAAVDLCGG